MNKLKRADYLWTYPHLNLGLKLLLFPIYMGIIFTRYWNINWDLTMEYNPKEWVTRNKEGD